MFKPTLESNPSPDDLQFIEDQINNFNIRTTGYDDYQPLAIFVRDDTQQIIAGLTGFTWGKGCMIGFLWVDEKYRHAGYGTQLMQQAEEEACRRGCLVIVVGTHSFQAPDFYPKLGYTTVGVQEDWPAGYRQYSFSKRLEPRDPKQEVLATEQVWTQAHLDGDFAAIEGMMAEEYTRINPDGSVSHKAEVLATYQLETRHWELAQSDQHEILLNGNCATVIGRWTARGINNSEPFDYQARFLSVYIQRKGKWLMLAEQSTEIR
ncbi:MAG: GNAT family N-acetyltransferase [Caldilineaceae bacterium]